MQLKPREEEILRKIDRRRIPAHVAMIMDGNGRWARERGLPRSAGHRQGVETVRDVVRFSNYLGIKVLTLFAFSTENWHRPAQEINFLMSLPEQYLQTELPELVKNNVRVQLIGDPEGLPGQVRRAINEGLAATAKNSGMVLNFALNYGARMEIVRAVQALIRDLQQGKIEPSVNEATFAAYLYTAGLPDPDLLIRTGGEHRISNFLLWQLAYSELWFTPVYWPDFCRQHLLQAISDFQQRERRYGKISGE
ncbi:MAG: isoprenyl transferase [Dethiobacteria bacterium]|jgi:undecaprenyl diphosphate synthase|nr:isoprenyl transferase [Bacillota bacterium]NMD33264.1 isoprenyl transferase [Bacillota bacterium]HOB29404.1 isoprenyl transferase [Bacillota bacterium]HPZ42001.1 isoprenyl transferase [Bacillota bacterium]HQD52904.1 isoprenyl transferase [Bacillota bacterium]